MIKRYDIRAGYDLHCRAILEIDVETDGSYCKWEDVEKLLEENTELQVQLDIAKKENDRASETFIHNFALLKENRIMREALEFYRDKRGVVAREALKKCKEVGK